LAVLGQPSQIIRKEDSQEWLSHKMRQPNTCYLGIMTKRQEFYLEMQIPEFEEEDEETLAAIDKGIRDADAGRTTPMEEVRKLLHKWVAARS
jgi:hypothetical protein